jgi:hypothetical protein
MVGDFTLKRGPDAVPKVAREAAPGSEAGVTAFLIAERIGSVHPI